MNKEELIKTTYSYKRDLYEKWYIPDKKYSK